MPTTYNRDWYLKNKKRLSDKFKIKYYGSKEFRDHKYKIIKQFRNQWRLKALQLLGEKCANCGFSDQRALQIDHINGDGYLDRKRESSSHWKRVCKSVSNNEEKFQILCCNCNWIKRVENGEQAYRGRKSALDDHNTCKSSQKLLTFSSI